ncbi:MAG: Mini-ribonuclease 3 [Clostridiales Family XIII bacterium]|jgi:ribonuclease-3 family protein|nr:Mini-ribonuclease 3 [Clostridiales Family XIII bacterium]
MTTDAARVNTAVLAWVGDAAYELRVRTYLAKSGAAAHADALHRAAVRYVRADAQAAVVKEIFDTLPPEEQALVKRARNHKISTKPKNADPVTYKWATAFEALIGYYHLSGAGDKADGITEKAIAIIDGK